MVITTSWCRPQTAPIWRAVSRVRSWSSTKMPGMAGFSSTTTISCRRRCPSLAPDAATKFQIGDDIMKAFVVDKYKKKGALRLANMPEPQSRDDDVLVRVHATAVNVLDSKLRDGEFKLILPYRPPF